VNERLLRVAGRIRNELDELAHVLDRAQEAMRRAKQTSDDFYWDSVALNLHGLYAGLERLFEIIAATIDGNVPQGANWHQVLLAQMAKEIPQARPAVISGETRTALDEYRGFRHVVRNVYTFRFNPVKVERLVKKAPALFSQVRTELLAFADFIERRAMDDASMDVTDPSL
jgi:hypothetical protein